VLLSPHLDDGTGTMHWRNMLHYDPYKKDKYGWSYWDIMVQPMLTAANAAFQKPGKTIWLSPQVGGGLVPVGGGGGSGVGGWWIDTL
jgi:hypothetical protein